MCLQIVVTELKLFVTYCITIQHRHRVDVCGNCITCSDMRGHIRTYHFITEILLSLTCIAQDRCKKPPNLEDIRTLDEAHEGKKATVGPAMDGNTAQVHKLKLLRHILQPLHLVFNLYLTLRRQS